jgi:hypothetical protein
MVQILLDPMYMNISLLIAPYLNFRIRGMNGWKWDFVLSASRFFVANNPIQVDTYLWQIKD